MVKQQAETHQSDHAEIASRLISRYGDTFAKQAHIRLHNTPAPLFQLLVLSLLLSARIASENAVSAAQSLFKSGYTTPQKMASATWQQRVDAITWSGYKRYDERTATMLGDTAELVQDKYGGDLRELAKEAEDDVGRMHKHLQQFKGIGAVGADIFLREVQAVWQPVYPYADDVVRHVAQELGLPNTTEQLSQLCSPQAFPQLCAALMRIKLAGEQKKFLEQN